MFYVGQKISFYCGGCGRGGHNTAFCIVEKVNRKTVWLKEVQNSYYPGKLWNCDKEWLIQNLTCAGMTVQGYNEGLQKVYGDLSR